MKEINSKAKLISALMYSDSISYKKAVDGLIKKFGLIEFESKEYKFNFTDYYKKEMCSNLLKKFICFKKLIKKGDLAHIKNFTIKLEEKYKKKGKRKINIDPGYITINNLVLGSIKERPHKVYLSKGIYADLNLLLKKKSCVNFPWTFADYQLKFNQEFFLKVRKNLLDKIK
jgi:hypothetical protein